MDIDKEFELNDLIWYDYLEDLLYEYDNEIYKYLQY